MFEIIISLEAEIDIKEASLWYALKRDGLDKEFFICVEAAISILRRNPELFSKLDDSGIRKVNTQRFPYGVYYHVSKNEILILAVRHLMENPEKWKKRLV